MSHSYSHHSLQDIIETAEKLGNINPACDLVLTKEQNRLYELQAHEADGFSQQCIWALEHIGLLLASAGDNVNSHTVTNTGYAISQLAEYASTMRSVQINANFMLAGDFSKFPSLAEWARPE